MDKVDYTYSPNGNLSYKQDCGNYDYTNTNKPYQITGIQNPVGNISLLTLSITHNDINKVSQISEATSNKVFDFVYGNDGERIKMEYRLGGSLQYTRYYADNYDRQETSSGYKDWCYVHSPTGLTAVYFDNNGTAELLDVTSDHLGSPLLLTDANGTIAEEYSFDAWGRRRDPSDWTNYSGLSTPQKMIRGFTGHEHLDEVGVINMNGRIYDPVLGRFIETDPFIQNPYNIQNMNRYSYVLNNPVNFVDPSGYRYIAPKSTGKVSEENAGLSKPSLNPYANIVLYVDDIRIEPGGGGYSMFMNGGGGIGVATRQNFGVWTGNGPGLKGASITMGAMVDFANANRDVVRGISGRGVLVKLEIVSYGVLINPVSGKVTHNKNFGLVLEWTDMPVALSGGSNLADGFGQLINAGGVVYGGAEMGLQAMRNGNAAQVISRATGFGTQQTAQALRGTLGVVSKVGKGLGVAGYGLQVATTGYKLYNGQSVGTAEAVGLGISTAFVGAGVILAGTAAAPFVAAGALIYGAFQLGSYIYNGNTLEENYFGK